MKPRLRVCAGCGKEELTASTTRLCLLCFCNEKAQRNDEKSRQLLEQLYDEVSIEGSDRHGKRLWAFTHVVCGTRQTWMIGNVKKQLKARPGIVPCSTCGAKERQEKAMAGYVAKYQLDERARTDLRAYTRKVRGLSEKTYRENIETLNPQRLRRGRGNQGYHLDHIISIVECFKRGWTPEQAAALHNLQLLEATHNLSKGRK